MYLQNTTKLDPAAFEETPRVETKFKLSRKVEKCIEQTVIDTLKEIEDNIKEGKVINAEENEIFLNEEKYNSEDDQAVLTPREDNDSKQDNKCHVPIVIEAEKGIDDNTSKESIASSHDTSKAFAEVKEIKTNQPELCVVHNLSEINFSTLEHQNESAVEQPTVCAVEHNKEVPEANSDFEEKIKEAIVSIELEENTEEGEMTDEELTKLKNKCLSRLKNVKESISKLILKIA